MPETKNKSMPKSASNENIFVLIKFKVGGNLRFLSHSETVEVFRRACVRAELQVQYTKGFNPHPRLSLPLPRSVGVESDDELLCLRIKKSSLDIEQLRAALAEQLPVGIELFSATTSKTKPPFQPCVVTYVLDVRPKYVNEELKTTTEQLLASKSLTLDRQTDANGTRFKSVDVRRFIKSVVLTEKETMQGTARDGGTAAILIVVCEISPAGSIRIEEILKLLGLDVEKLASPVRRTNVQWQQCHN
jgi:radical SAM-linked protein